MQTERPRELRNDLKTTHFLRLRFLKCSLGAPWNFQSKWESYSWWWEDLLVCNILDSLFLSLHPHHRSHFQVLRIITYCMLIWRVRKSHNWHWNSREQRTVGLPSSQGASYRIYTWNTEICFKKDIAFNLDSFLNIISWSFTLVCTFIYIYFGWKV